jgi:hypothetical protein
VAALCALGVLAGVRLSGTPGTDAGIGSSVPSVATGPAPTLRDPPPGDPSAVDLGGLHFTDVTSAAGLAEPHSSAPLLGDVGQTAGVAVADVFGTGRMDVFMSRVGKPNSLYRNNGDGTFTDVAAQVGVGGRPGQSSGAAAFADFEGKGCPDLYVATAAGDRDSFYVNDCQGRFTERSVERGLVLPPNTVPGGSTQQ